MTEKGRLLNMRDQEDDNNMQAEASRAIPVQCILIVVA